ncbi:hypothetical protein [Fodinicola feengrottensis]|uniref:hypothetical protein n=1 Tax=Fodinicola feengrottensis TaxID=435914 RepID=UPI0013D59E33|nr:hypothetical protein [Fodinicola feengrottensis]
MQVEVDQAAQPLVALDLRLRDGGLFGGVEPDQVVHPIAVRHRLTDQVRGLQFAQLGAR